MKSTFFWLLSLSFGLGISSLYSQDCSAGRVRCVDVTAGAHQEYTTIQAAANAALPGDTVLVFPGKYAGFYTVRSGKPDSMIVFKASVNYLLGDSVIINVTNSKVLRTFNDSFARGNIQIQNTNYIVIDGFVVERNQARAGINTLYTKGVIIKNNLSRWNARWNIFSGWCKDLQILDNDCFATMQGSEATKAPEHGIYVSNSNVPNDDIIVRGNISHANNQSGIQVNGDCDYPDSNGVTDGVVDSMIIEDNILFDNKSKSFSLISMTHSLVRNNLVYNNGLVNGAAGIHLDGACGGHGNVIINNTVVEPRIPGIRSSNGSAGNIFFNNISISANGSSSSGATGPCIDQDHANYFDTNLCRVYDTALVNTYFVNDNAGNFHLKTGSPAINAGVATDRGNAAPARDIEGRTRPQGTAFDMGAYEWINPAVLEKLELAMIGPILRASPNPFTPATGLTYVLPAGTRDALLEVYTMSGRRLTGWRLPGDRGTVQWAGTDQNNRPAPAGVYIVKLSAGKVSRSCAVTLVR